MASMPNSTAEDPAAELTAREREILQMVAAGKANKQIAAELVISERTARTHVSNILRKLDLSSRTQGALWAVREGLAARRRGGRRVKGRPETWPTNWVRGGRHDRVV
jgi:DNA-binding NarL/FixJ family response regulator